MSFAASSKNIRLEHGHILHAECKDREGDFVDSHIDLDHHIGNTDGWFQWDAKDFSHSASDIKLRGFHLEAQLKKRNGEYREERQGINLDDRISNQNGRLTYSAN